MPGAVRWPRSSCWEQHGLLPTVSASKKKQGTRLKKYLGQGMIKNMAVAPKSEKHHKKLAVEAEIHSEKKNTVHKHETRPHKAAQEGSSQGIMMHSKQREHSILPYSSVTLEQQPMISFPLEPSGLSARPQRFSSVILQPCATPGPLLLQPQVPNAAKQDSVAAALEWQRKLEAAEALLALKTSCQAPPDSAPLQKCGNMPANGQYLKEKQSKPKQNYHHHNDNSKQKPVLLERVLQPHSSYLPPQPESSVSLTGHLECVSFLS
ncbi:doublesex- and mab-3-related transcription factor C1-like [Acomys russatus]|uniref:doublesex- and mab-3-related transcription factor C1-like n=1 Tax=Acomys russatus TaxID=60746 RepID=UPI0021E1E13B|nr:doublesex- and mab-3-related transcription factor C1-like [Acomys russatus]